MSTSLVSTGVQFPDSTIQTTAASGSLATFSNLKLSASGTNASIIVSADEIILENDVTAYITARAVSLTINSAGSGANGLDTGTLAASTWYSVWVIWNGTTIAGLISASTTAPALPSGYTYKVRVGWVRTDGTANKYPLGFSQYGSRVSYNIVFGGNLTAYPQMATGAAGTVNNALGGVAIGTSAFVPSTASIIYIKTLRAANQTAISRSINVLDAGGALLDDGYAFAAVARVMFQTANTIYWASNGANTIFCEGWEDNL